MARMMMAVMSKWGVWVPEVVWLHFKLLRAEAAE
jgi:hypothetical protein